MSKKVVLAYSGGLDTTVAIPWLKERGYEVIAFSADVGQGEKRFDVISKRAKIAGAKKIIVKDLRREFIQNYAFKALKAHALYEDKYYLATALSRPLIAKNLIDIAKKEKADAVVHGCTGKGNDQVRFEVTIKVLAPKLKIIAPLRDWELKSRAEEIEYAKKRKIPIEIKDSAYSIDRNIWGVSIECGVLEEIDKEAPEDVFLITNSIEKAPKNGEYVEIEFKKGLPVGLNGKAMDSVKLVESLNKIGGKHGIGRVDMIENRLIGIKSREIYESPAAALLYFAHRELESLILDRESSHFKNIVSQKYAEIIYYGLMCTPLKSSLDAFIDTSQTHLTGKIKLKLQKGNIKAASRESKFSKYNIKLATYGKGDMFDHKASEGFIKIWAQTFQGEIK
ncbi:MAG: argininosuccinate synthase [Candidatus Saelkia tenebricola]|nr:argininosuccinate synthase [Candidatus Saelkia tenebricola]